MRVHRGALLGTVADTDHASPRILGFHGVVRRVDGEGIGRWHDGTSGADTNHLAFSHLSLVCRR
jgi:hypothetical protein